MQHKVFRSALGALLALGVIAVFTTPTLAGPRMTHHGSGRLNKLATYLGLTDSQKQQIMPILKEAAQQVKALKANATLNPSEKQQQIRAIHKSTNAQIRSILTPEQREKLKALRENQRAKQ